MSGVTGAQVQAEFVISDCGDSAVRLTSLAPDVEDRWRVVHAVAAALDARGDAAAITGAIPTYDALLIEFDCGVTTHNAIRELVERLIVLPAEPATRSPRQVEVPVVYGGDFGPDLDDVAAHLGLSPAEVIRVHGSSPLTMRCFGSPGGAPMLDGPAFPQPVPRRTVPRPHVPAGAVAVAGRQAVISARPAPGGWPVIGRTPLTMVDLATESLSDFRPGDTFRFFPITEAAWSTYEGARRG
ncbi:5-oxoprolinase subunit B family protein [Rhodococcus jostii]|uniref:Sensor histidine kinase inhibitor, KipI family n=1 Tax=Rhodococcus jostii TaxID=132919 RepID=A0A1H5EJ26_RHOJO|nr:carboxyltransferase domain-containing protein [Rhodococcus jostii]SED91147.1 sensor histidine kinase inhibitor, KipI family [Rhodococcus jostii]